MTVQCGGVSGARGGCGSWPVLAVVLAVGTGLAVAPACAPARPASARGSGSAAPRELAVCRGSYVQRRVLTGEIRPVNASDIVVPTTPSWQVLIRWMEADGDEVAVGQKVIEFDNSTFVASLEANRLAASHAANECARQEAQNAVTLAEKEFNQEARRVALAKAAIDADIPPELMSPRDYQDRQLARQRAEAEYEKARDELVAARAGCEADLKVARIASRKRSVRCGLPRTPLLP